MGIDFNTNLFSQKKLIDPNNQKIAQGGSAAHGTEGTKGPEGVEGQAEGGKGFSVGSGSGVYSFSGGNKIVHAGTAGSEPSEAELIKMMEQGEDLQKGVDGNIETMEGVFEELNTQIDTEFSELESINTESEVVNNELIDTQDEAVDVGEDIKENAMTMGEAQGQIKDFFAQKEDLQNQISEKVQGAGYDDISKMQEEAEAKQKEIEAKTEELKSLPEGDPRREGLAAELQGLIYSCGDIRGVMAEISELQSQMTDLDAQLYNLVSGFEENQEFQESLMNKMDGIDRVMGRLNAQSQSLGSSGERLVTQIGDGLTKMAFVPISIVAGQVGTVAAAGAGVTLVSAGKAVKIAHKSTGQKMINRGNKLINSAVKGNVLKSSVETALGNNGSTFDPLKAARENNMRMLEQQYNDAQNALRNGMGFEYNGESYTMGDVYTDTSNFVAGNLDGLNGAINEARNAMKDGPTTDDGFDNPDENNIRKAIGSNKVGMTPESVGSSVGIKWGKGHARGF